MNPPTPSRPSPRSQRRQGFEDAIAHLAVRQHGVVTRSQLLELGLSRRSIEGRRERGRLIPVHRGVYLLGSLRGPLRPERAREMAAVLASGSGAVLSHRSAAWLWELLPRPPERKPVDVTIPSRVRRCRPGIHIRRSRHLSAGETTVRHGIPVTRPGRTLRDLSAVVGSRELSRALARAGRKRLLAPDELERILVLHAGRAGVAPLRGTVQAERDPRFTRSEAEERFLDLIESGGLVKPQVNVLCHGHELDFLWRAEGLAVEVDGYEFHVDRGSFENDRGRDAELAAVGIHVIRVTWRQITEDATQTLVRVAQALVHGARSTVRR